MREQAVLDEWSELLVKWTEAHELALARQRLLDQKITNHFVYDKAAPAHSDQQEIDALWQSESAARSKLDAFISQHVKN